MHCASFLPLALLFPFMPSLAHATGNPADEARLEYLRGPGAESCPGRGAQPGADKFICGADSIDAGAGVTKPGAQASKPGAQASKPGAQVSKHGAQVSKPGAQVSKHGAGRYPTRNAAESFVTGTDAVLARLASRAGTRAP
jgi:hypothetical protein